MKGEKVFEMFWELFPRKLARKDAVKAWAKIAPHKQLDVLEALRKHVVMWKQQGTEKQFIPYPATWLNGARWEDEIEIAPEMPQCDWNKNLNRGEPARCAEQAVKKEGDNHFCPTHCARLGLKFLRAA